MPFDLHITLLQYMVSLEKVGRYDESAEAASEIVSQEPRNDLSLAYASHVENLAGYHGRGLEYALAAIRINPAVPLYTGVTVLCQMFRKFMDRLQRNSIEIL
ncbi:MAG: hypothetical protein AB2L14_10075 [Candidatus Xenobiia bacterium LiM19]